MIGERERERIFHERERLFTLAKLEGFVQSRLFEQFIVKQLGRLVVESRYA